MHQRRMVSWRNAGQLMPGQELEPVINFPADSVASENRARRGGGRRLWPFQGEDDNKVSRDFHPSDQDPSLGTPDLRRDPKGWGQFSRFRCRSSLADARYPPHEQSSRGPRGMRHSSLPELGKTGSQRCLRESLIAGPRSCRLLADYGSGQSHEGGFEAGPRFRRGPPGREQFSQALSQGFVRSVGLHPGLFSTRPSGTETRSRLVDLKE